MSVRTALVFLLAATTAAVAGWTATRERTFEPRYQGSPPNVLFLSIDTLRADHLGIYGYDRNTTPEIDAWAKDAVVFDNAQASASWTLPGLATVLTSYYSSTHRCWTFNSRLDPSYPTLPEMLADSGYDTMAVTSHVFLARRYGLQQGFVHFDDEFAHPVEDPTSVVTSEMVSDKGIRFLEQKAASGDATPWMLWLHYFDPHGQYVVHAGISEEFGIDTELDRYDGEIRFTDLHVGRVLDKLAALGFDRNTLVVFFSDHGEEFQDHGAARHGHALYRELVRVPLIVGAPGIPGRRVPELVRTVDILPTVLDFVPPLVAPDGIEGTSLLPVLEGRAPRDLPALAEIRLEERTSYDCVVDGRWKLIVDATERTFELYDVEADPLETTEVGADHPDVVAELKQTMRRLIERAQQRAQKFQRAGTLGLTQTQLEQMQGLGYLGGD